MKKFVFIIFTFLIISGLIWYFFFQSKMVANAPEYLQKEEPKIVTAEKGWIEVENRGVYLVNNDNTLGTELKTGDEVTTGQILMTDKIGLASLHFSDGSVVRLESQTKISLDNFEYFADSKSLKVKMFLQTGKVWSRIKALMTLASYWEVQTTNAVVAVRGTSYGVAYIPGQTTIIGSVHLINISAVDPQTKKVLENNVAFVGENQYLVINNQEIKSLLSGVKLNTKVKPYSTKIKSDSWVIKAKEADKRLDEQITPETKPESSDELLARPLDGEDKTIKPITTNPNEPVSSGVLSEPNSLTTTGTATNPAKVD